MLHLAQISLSNHIFLIGLITHQDQASWFFSFAAFAPSRHSGLVGVWGGLKGGGCSYRLSRGASAEWSRFREIWLIQVIGSDKSNWGQGWWGGRDCEQGHASKLQGVSAFPSWGNFAQRGEEECMWAVLLHNLNPLCQFDPSTVTILN